jgi:hypothetical protein
MANWAILIGINQYWEASRNLKGAVGDAMRMAQWLLNSVECRVLPENMFLLTRPKPELIPAGVKYRDAVADELLQVIPELDGLSGPQGGDRFFFYFSGHGVTNTENFHDEQALVMADFTPVLTNKAVKFTPIKDYFKAMPFQEQFFFIDACRNLLDWDYDFETGSTTKKKQIDKTKPAVDQFILNSTALGTKAWEGPLPGAEPGDERGAFTAALLDGLNGDGTAKVYSNNDDDYIVQKEALFDYVVQKVEARKIYVIKDPVHPVIQKPRKDGENVKNPILARLDVNAVKPETLELVVEPDLVWPLARLKLRADQGAYEKTFDPPITGIPLPIQPLQPMNYTVFASAPNYVLEGKNKERRSFPLYETTKISVRLVPLEIDIDSPSDPDLAGGEVHDGPTIFIHSAGVEKSLGRDISFTDGARGLDDEPFIAFNHVKVNSEVFRDLEDRGDNEFERLDFTVNETTLAFADDSSQQVHLIVDSSDPLAPLEITDSAGALLKTGVGHLEFEGEGGFYRARLVTPEGQNVEEVLELSPGETETVLIDAPRTQQSHLLEQLLKFIEVRERDDQTLEFPSPIGPIAAVELPTVLTLLANAVNRGEDWLQSKPLAELGLAPFDDVREQASGGLQIIFGLELSCHEKSSGYLSDARVLLWRHGQTVSESREGSFTLAHHLGLGEFQMAAEPGSYWLVIKAPNRTPVIFSVVVLPGRLTMLVSNRERDGRNRVFQYLPELDRPENSDQTLLRRLGLMQRFSLTSCFHNAYQLVEELIPNNLIDPVECVLAGYLAARLEKSEALLSASTAIRELFPELSDGYVLNGEYHAAMGDDEAAAAAYRSALDRGLPIFANGLVRLYEGLQRYGITHPRIELLREVHNNRVRGLLWSAWSVAPDKFSSGWLPGE